jgi:cell division protein FtsB
MKVSLWKIGFAVLFLGCVGYGFVELRGANGVSGLVEKRREVHDLEQQNQLLHKEIEAKKLRIERLRDNPEEQELEIRKRLKLVKPGEKSFILQEQKK